MRTKFGTVGINPGDRIHPFFKMFFEAQDYFFLATSNAQGECDCSFRGGYPVVKVVDDQTIVFPDYPGNGAFQSMGNIVENPHVGMLFIDFERAIRIRVNGTARIVDDIEDEEIAALFPGAQQYVIVSTEQVFGNCNARIPTLVRAEHLRPRR